MAQVFEHIHLAPEGFRSRAQRPLVRLEHYLLVQTGVAAQIDDTASSGPYFFLYLIDTCYDLRHPDYPASLYSAVPA